MVALAIIAIAFTAMLSSQARNVTLAAESKFQTTAPLLAQDIMTRYRTAHRTGSASEQGEWDSAFPGYRWQLQATPVTMAGGANLTGLYRVDLQVTWNEQQRYTYHHRGYLFTPTLPQ
jgi:Tfp pilus assembly protein PilV